MYTIWTFSNTAGLYFVLYLSHTAQNKYAESNLIQKIYTYEQYIRAKPCLEKDKLLYTQFWHESWLIFTYKISSKRNPKDEKEHWLVLFAKIQVAYIFTYVERHPNNLMSFFYKVYSVETSVCQEHPIKIYWGRIN